MAHLGTAIENHEFRQDLFYRLNVLPITVPPLRDRIEDFDSLADLFVHILDHKLNLRYTGLSDGAPLLLKQYEWPGNIRELENAIERALQETDWNQSKAARQLGITRNHLRYRIKKYRIIK